MPSDDASTPPITDDRHDSPDESLDEYVNDGPQESQRETTYEPEQASEITTDDRDTIERESTHDTDDSEDESAGEQQHLVPDVDEDQQTIDGGNAQDQSLY